MNSVQKTTRELIRRAKIGTTLYIRRKSGFRVISLSNVGLVWSCEISQKDYEEVMKIFLIGMSEEVRKGAKLKVEIDYHGAQRVIFKPRGILGLTSSRLYLSDRHIQFLSDAAYLEVQQEPAVGI